MSADSQSDHGFDLFNPTEEHDALRRMVRDFVSSEVEPQAMASDREEKFNRELFRQLGELDLLGITVPDEAGGAGFDATAAVIAHEEISASDPGFALAYLAHSMLFVNNFYQNSNDEQRARWLPKSLNGDWVGGMCMSEPGVGTDVLGMTTKAERDGDNYIINGRKMWITNGGLEAGVSGDIFLVYAKTGGNRISSFIVEKDRPGFSLGEKIGDKLGCRSSFTAGLVFEDCVVPASNRLGEEGDSMMHMMANLEIERLTLAAMSLGIAKRCLQVMVRYASEREAFGQPINRFGQIQRYIGESYAKYAAARAYTYNTARMMSIGATGGRVDSDGCKLFAAQMGKEVADNAIQVLGGFGYVGEYVVERLWRDAKLIEIGGGTIEAHQKNITKDLTRSMEELLD
ncbi:MAG: acyl-CoA dehydrogenase family protein [Planctomycetota bacterium]|nr:acyl-CoA dehydrogenase family protein [Planctomycetota bacterium]